MRLIDAEQFLVFGYDYIPEANFADGVSYVLDKIDNAPTIDAVEVVRCKDYKYYMNKEIGLVCYRGKRFVEYVEPDDFCSKGEIKNDTD